jgi:quercetin 2,3-dioxygenase
MKDTAQASMFLAIQREQLETAEFRTSASICNGNSNTGSLLLWNDEVVAPGKSITHVIENDVLILLMPVVGELTYHDSEGRYFEIAAGETMTLPLQKGTSIAFTNPFTDNLINFLCGVFEYSANEALLPAKGLFNLDNNKNNLIAIPSYSSNMFIGKFSGRQEVTLPLSSPGKKVFVFVIEGAFEVHHRLLETRDGMILSNTTLIDIEALSNDAIILVVGC